MRKTTNQPVPYPTSFQAVDIAAIHITGNTRFVLLGRKPGQEKLRFPGGFADPASVSLEDDAARELKEETGIVASALSMRYVGSVRVNDPRYHGSIDCIKTALFITPIRFDDVAKMAKADDDLEEVVWVRLQDLNPNDLVQEHRVLCRMLIDFLDHTV